MDVPMMYWHITTVQTGWGTASMYSLASDLVSHDTIRCKDSVA